MFAAVTDEFDTCLVELAMGNRLAAYDEGAFCREEASCRLLDACRVIRRRAIYQSARRDVFCRLGMPTRATAIHAGGSLAGKVSIRLSVISSVIAPVSIF